MDSEELERFCSQIVIGSHVYSAVNGFLPLAGTYVLATSAPGTELLSKFNLFLLSGFVLPYLYPEYGLSGSIKLPSNGADTDPSVDTCNHSKLLFFI